MNTNVQATELENEFKKVIQNWENYRFSLINQINTELAKTAVRKTDELQSRVAAFKNGDTNQRNLGSLQNYNANDLSVSYEVVCTEPDVEPKHGVTEDKYIASKGKLIEQEVLKQEAREKLSERFDPQLAIHGKKIIQEDNNVKKRGDRSVFVKLPFFSTKREEQTQKFGSSKFYSDKTKGEQLINSSIARLGLKK